MKRRIGAALLATMAATVAHADRKSRDHDNLYLVGCGSHVTVGTQNPTLALAARTADAILARKS